MRTNFRRVCCGLLLAALACGTSSYGQRAAYIRQEFLQLNDRQVLNCLGPPSDFDYPDEQKALWVYAYPLPNPAWLSERSVGAGMGMDRKIREFLNDPLDAALPAGFCRLTIELVSGRVTNLRAEARTATGLNNDSECVHTARMCLH